MEVIKTDFEGLLIIKPSVFSDSRGYFFESYNSIVWLGMGIDFKPVQDNESKSSKGVIRGLHYQLNPFGQAKLIRVVSGVILDVALDLRRSAPTYGRHFSYELSSESKSQILIPRGFAHGFSVLSETAIIQYKVDNVFNSKSERGINIFDTSLEIDWKTDLSHIITSEKDRNNPGFAEAEKNF
jgi:dTDP-4-dehydrorhamnose 3,5-epimerase